MGPAVGVMSREERERVNAEAAVLRQAGWTDDKHALLVRLVREGSGWKELAELFGAKARDLKARYQRLVGEGDRPLPARASVRAKPEPERADGLEWLVKKQRLDGRQMAQAWGYRKDFQREALDGAAIKSALAEAEAIKGGRGAALTPVENEVAAKRRMFVRRYRILGGQSDMLMVLDAVCGRGRTLRELTAGDGHKAAALEAVLKVALDLLATHAGQIV